MPYLRMWCSTGGCDSSLYLMSCQAIWRLAGECDALLGEWCPTRRNSLAEHVIPSSAYWFFTSECDAWLIEVMPIEDYTAPLANTAVYQMMQCPTTGRNAPPDKMPNRECDAPLEDVMPHRIWFHARICDAYHWRCEAPPDVMPRQRKWCPIRRHPNILKWCHSGCDAKPANLMPY